MARAGKKFTSDWSGGFLFVGNQLALDFVNTRPVIDGAPMELLPDFEALLRWFYAAKLLRANDKTRLQKKWGGSPRARRCIIVALKLREQIRQRVITLENGRPISHSLVRKLNTLLAEHPMLTRLSVTGSTGSTDLWFDAQAPDDLLAPVAHSTAILFSELDRDRIRQCCNCVLHFYDTSKKGSRRWCSMQLCGNRLKVAAYAARQRAK